MADPQLEGVRAQLGHMAADDESVLEPRLLRERMRTLARQLDAREIPIGRVETIRISGAAGELPARIYTPIAAGAGKLPALVFFHGGWFVQGDLETHDTLCRGLAAHSACRVIAVDYRLAPEHPFPAAIEDGYAALRWIEANATAIGVDSNRIAVGGDCAGANIAIVVCLLARAAGNPAIQHQILLYPIAHDPQCILAATPNDEDIFANQKMREYFSSLYFGGTVSHTDFRAAPLMCEDVSKLPPAYLLTAGRDPSRDHALQYADRLRAGGVRVEHASYDDMIHGFMSMSAVLDAAKRAIERTGHALRQALT